MATSTQNSQIDQTLSQQLSVLNQISQSINSADSLEEISQNTCKLITKLIPAGSFCVGKFDAEEKMVVWHFIVENGERLPSVTDRLQNEIVVQAFERHGVIKVNLSEEERYKQLYQLTSADKPENLAKAIMVAPIVMRHEVRGFLGIKSYLNFYDDNHAELLSIIASHLALAIENVEGDDPQSNERKLLSVVGLARDVCHELNQPLTGIAGYCALIKEELDEKNPIYKDVEEIEKQSTRLQKLVFKLQNVAQFAGRENLNGNE